MVLRFLVYLILFYILFKVLRYFAKFIFGVRNQKEEPDAKSRLGIDKKDIIEARFEEIKKEEEKKSGANEN